MDGRPDDPQRILAQLAQRLEDLERAGVRWLNIAPHPEPLPLAVAAPAPEPEAEARPDTPARAAAGPPTEPPAPLADAAAVPGAPEVSTGAGTDATDAGGTAPDAIITLESLRFKYRDCRNCKLCDARANLVFGVGTDRPRLMFIGEGPGADEDAQGLPFVGRAGALLTGLIRAAGLVREDVYITNVVKCRPPGNRNPEPDEVASCRPILQRQIELLDPRLIVTLGNVPLKVLKPNAAGITRERGHPFAYQNWQALPTFHPSYLLRNPAAIETCWADIRKAMRMAYPPE